MALRQPLIIATRQSQLALWQANHVRSLLEQRGHAVHILGLTTRGDQILEHTLSKVGGKALFVKELETALQEGRADLAVHSLKDMPMQLPDGLTLACVLERQDPRDAFVSPRYAGLAELPSGAVLGTSSLRRQSLLRAHRPDLRIVPARLLRPFNRDHMVGEMLAESRIGENRRALVGGERGCGRCDVEVGHGRAWEAMG